jgi:hypothetical protein
MRRDGTDTRELLLRYANDISVLFDADFRIVDCNARALEVCGQRACTDGGART